MDIDKVMCWPGFSTIARFNSRPGLQVNKKMDDGDWKFLEIWKYGKSDGEYYFRNLFILVELMCVDTVINCTRQSPWEIVEAWILARPTEWTYIIYMEASFTSQCKFHRNQVRKRSCVCELWYLKRKMSSTKYVAREKNTNLSLFETEARKGGAAIAYKFFASTVFAGIVLIWLYRLIYIPGVGESGRWVWIGMFFSELLFGFYWIITQSVRWNVVHRHPFRDRLPLRCNALSLISSDIFMVTF